MGTLGYNPDTGEFFRTVKGIERRIPGAADRDGYIRIYYQEFAWRAHRLAHYLMTGEKPPRHLDINHINNIRTDNRWCNLRAVDKATNCANRRYTRNKSGYVGVSKLKNGKFSASDITRGNRKWIGQFSTFEEAVAAHKAYTAALPNPFGAHQAASLNKIWLLWQESSSTEKEEFLNMLSQNSQSTTILPHYR
jgi:hypothetical protein